MEEQEIEISTNSELRLIVLRTTGRERESEWARESDWVSECKLNQKQEEQESKRRNEWKQRKATCTVTFKIKSRSTFSLEPNTWEIEKHLRDREREYMCVTEKELWNEMDLAPAGRLQDGGPSNK